MSFSFGARGSWICGQWSQRLENLYLLDNTHINDNNLPVRLFLVQERHHTKDLDLLDLASVAHQFADLANVQRIIVTLGFGLGVNDVGIFPGLQLSAK